MSDKHSKPRRRILTPYVLFWVAGAIFASIYLAVLGTHPELFASAQSGPDLEKELAQTQRDMSRAFADLDPLRQSVGQIKMDVDNLKTAQREAADRDTLILDKVTALESASAKPQPMAQAPREAVPQATPQVATSQATAPPEPHKVAAATPPKPAPEAAPAQDVVSVAPIKPQKAAAAAPKSETAIETGSIARAKAQTPPKKPAEVGLLLGTGPSVDALRLNWTILNDRHGDAMQNLHPRYVTSGKGNERSYALLAGPVASTEQAKTLCKLMTDRGLACEVSTYRGTAF